MDGTGAEAVVAAVGLLPDVGRGPSEAHPGEEMVGVKMGKDVEGARG